jgi:hypothetical protein
MTNTELHQRILALHAQGLRVLDIASMLSLHPQIVIRALELANA